MNANKNNDYQKFLEQILYLNKKGYNPKLIRRILKISNPKDSIPRLKVKISTVLAKLK